MMSAKRLSVVVCAAALMLGGAPARASSVAVGEVIEIAKVTRADKGKLLTVQGEVASARRFSAGMRYVLTEGAARITLVVFDRTLKSLTAATTMNPGAIVRATGKIDQYLGEMQIVPRTARDVVVVKGVAAEAVPLKKLGDIKPADKGKTVAVEGVVVNAASFSAGFKFTLNDGTGQIVMVLFEKEYDGLLNRESLNVGARVAAKGEVDVYLSELELLPSAKEVVVTPGHGPAAQAYKLGAINGNDHNALALVQGEIAAVEPFESGTNLLLKDATGAQKIVLYANVAKRVPKSVKLTVGNSIVVVGRIKASRYTGIKLEVALPFDVASAPANVASKATK